MITLFFADGCPYAHRTRSLLTHLSLPFESRVIDLRNKPADFLALSPTGRVPMLLDDGVALYESYVLDEYVAEKAGWADAFGPTLVQRARERLAMLQFDAVIGPAHVDSMKAGAAFPETRRAAMERELDELAKTAALAPFPSLLAFHVGPHWLRQAWMGDRSAVVVAVKAQPALLAWLDRAAAIPAIRDTAPEREPTIRLLERLLGIEAA